MNYQQMLELFNPLFERFANLERLVKEPPLLAHHTSIKVDLTWVF
jgi:hypothetical protein